MSAPMELRHVPARRALDWYGDAIRLWKGSPVMLCVLAFVSLAVELALQLIPDAGMLASKVLAPIVACGLYVGTHAVAGGGRARLGDALRPFGASAPAIAAIVASSLLVFAAEAGAAWAIAGVNLLRAGAGDAGMDEPAVFAMFAVGMIASLPLTLIPMSALFDRAGFAKAFDVSIAAFTRNVPAFLLYGVLSYLLLVVGLLTFGLGLLIVMPLWATSAYSAWRDLVHGVAPAPRR
ncbi:MAG TPA: hypothetical protein VIH36_12390 [Casimicrobiaceae bacterium]|jgi:hypothetical protein